MQTYHMMQRLNNILSKVVVLGESNVGKTSVVVRGTRDEFYEFQEPTIGAAFLSTERIVHDTRVRLEIWDTAGQERYRSLAPMYYRGASVAIIVYDITCPDSLVRAREWIKELSTKMSGNDCGIVLVGNKCDLGEMSERMARAADEVVRDNSVVGAAPIQHMMVSAKTGEGIERLFAHVCVMVHGIYGNTKKVGEDDVFILSSNKRGGGGYVGQMRAMCGI